MEVEYSLFPLSGSVCCRHEACEARCRSGRRRHMLVCYCQCRETGRSCGRTGAGRLSAGAVTDLRMKAASSLLSSCIPPSHPPLLVQPLQPWLSITESREPMTDPGRPRQARPQAEHHVSASSYTGTATDVFYCLMDTHESIWNG